MDNKDLKEKLNPGKFDVKGILKNFLDSAEKPSADPRMISILGLVGVLLIFVAILVKAWDTWTGWNTANASSAGREVAENMLSAIEPYRGISTNPEFLALAQAVFERPEAAQELDAWLENRLGASGSVGVYPGTVKEQVPEELGPNGFTLVSMMYIAAQGVTPPLQIHNSLEPPQLVGLVEIRDGDEVKGYLSFSTDAAPLLDGFNPDVGPESYIALRQDYGRQSSKPLKDAGNVEFAPAQPDRILVPGTLLRVEVPLHQSNELLPWARFFTIIIVGLLMLGAARILHEKNKRWLAAAEAKEEERRAAKALKAERKAKIEEKKKAARLTDQTDKPQQPPDGEGVTSSAETKSAAASKNEAEPPPMRLRYDLAERWKNKDMETSAVVLQESIFRAYDIRGEIGKTLDAGVAYEVGQSIGSATVDADAGPVVVARDGRLSGPELTEAMIRGITSTGCDVLDIGCVPTGVLYYAAYEKGAGTGVMVTGSHNPPSYNGFKVMIGGETLFGDQIKALYRRIADDDLHTGEGEITRLDILEDYIARVASDIKLSKPMKVVIDCGNGVGGICAAKALRAVGAEVMPLFEEVDGNFPNHHPDPSDPHNLVDLIESVKLMGADVGLALDGDADRLGVVTTEGEIIYSDRVMMLLAKDVLERVPGATIIYDVKCTGKLATAIEEAGGKAVMYKTGHSLIKARMKELGSPFAGEMSGHFFFEERWYGVDDGIYGAARLLEILSKSDRTATEILKELPTGVSTPEMKVEMNEGENHEFITQFQETAKFPGANVSTIDGLRADFEDGWGLCRASNTTPVVVLRFEADDEAALKRIQQEFAAQMAAINPNLDMPY
ncbi:MAG TPA: phosphomannomutase/phosphoglucomutase [Xanthomonadales bacterium]|nr:phosphomannomutase/phosphoglucomutase [Xanthomonadales bacterium]